MRYLQKTKSMIPSTKVYLGIYTKVEAVVVTTVVKLKEQLKLWQLTKKVFT